MHSACPYPEGGDPRAATTLREWRRLCPHSAFPSTASCQLAPGKRHFLHSPRTQLSLKGAEKGTGKGPRRLGQVIRTCLAHGQVPAHLAIQCPAKPARRWGARPRSPAFRRACQPEMGSFGPATPRSRSETTFRVFPDGAGWSPDVLSTPGWSVRRALPTCAGLPAPVTDRFREQGLQPAVSRKARPRPPSRTSTSWDAGSDAGRSLRSHWPPFPAGF